MSPSHSHPCVLNQRNGWVVRWFHAYWSFIWNWDDSGQWGSPGIPNTGEPALLLCRTYATIAYVRDNAVCRMPYEICRTGVRILSDDSWSHHSVCKNPTFGKLHEKGHQGSLCQHVAESTESSCRIILNDPTLMKFNIQPSIIWQKTTCQKILAGRCRYTSKFPVHQLLQPNYHSW